MAVNTSSAILYIARATQTSGNLDTPFICRAGSFFRGAAQLVARLPWEQEVTGSSPVTPTKVINVT